MRKTQNKQVMSRLQRDQEFSILGFPGRGFAKSQDPVIVKYNLGLVRDMGFRNK